MPSRDDSFKKPSSSDVGTRAGGGANASVLGAAGTLGAAGVSSACQSDDEETHRSAAGASPVESYRASRRDSREGAAYCKPQS